MLFCTAGAVIGTLLLVTLYDPNNYDSLAYRFPRVLLYLAQGNLRPLNSFDYRLSSYPFCGMFLYFLPGTWGVDGRLFNYVSFGCWLAGGVAVVAVAREMGVSRRGALIAASLYLTAPAVLISAASTNDDMIAGVPMLCAALFALRWWRTRGWADAGLAGVGAGLSVGTKLHGLFYDFTVMAAAIVILLHPTLRRVAFQTLRRSWKQFLAAGTIAALLAFPPQAINLFTSGSMMPMASGAVEANITLATLSNTPFSLVTAAATTAMNTAQLFLGDIPNMLFFETSESRLAALRSFNAFFNRHLFWWLRDDASYWMPFYKFRGVADVEPGTGAWEQSVTLGLMPWLLIVTLVVSGVLWRRRAGAGIAFWLALSLLLRDVSYSTHLKYGEAAGIYYAFVIALAAPSLAWLWDSRASLGRRAAGLVTVATILAFGGNVMVGLDSFLNNPQRNLRQLAAGSVSAASRDTVSADLAGTLGKMNKIDILPAHLEVEMFTLMMKNMKARYFISEMPSTDADMLNIYSYPSRGEYGNIPVRVANDSAKRLTLLGSYMGVGKELVFGEGALPPGLDSGHSGYVVFHSELVRDKTQAEMVKAIEIYGLVGALPDDALEFRLIQQASKGDHPIIADWRSVEGLSGRVRGISAQDAGRTGARVSRDFTFPLPQPSKSGFVELQLRQRQQPETIWSAKISLVRGIDTVPAEAITIPSYALGQVMDFRSSGGGAPYLGGGWSAAEGPGTWSVDETSTLRLQLPPRSGEPIRLTVKVMPFVAPRHAPMTIRVLANDVRVATWVFDRSEWTTVSADIPPDALSPTGLLTLSFYCDDVVAPASVNFGADTRRLKLLFETANIDRR